MSFDLKKQFKCTYIIHKYKISSVNIFDNN